MAARKWTIPFGRDDADLPDASFASPSVFPTNTRPCIAFDKDTDESVIFEGIVPNEYASGTLKCTLQIGANATTGTSRWDVVTEFITPGATESLNSDNFDGTPDSVTITMPGTAYCDVAGTITLTPATTPAAGDKFRLKLTRDANHSTDDTLGVDALFTGMEFYEE